MAPAAVVSDYDDSDICPDQPKNDQVCIFIPVDRKKKKKDR